MNATSKIVGSYALPNGATISIPAGAALNYAQMRAEQLRALSHLIGGENFPTWSEDIQVNVRWLAITLADEVASLMELVSADAGEIERLVHGGRS